MQKRISIACSLLLSLAATSGAMACLRSIFPFFMSQFSLLSFFLPFVLLIPFFLIIYEACFTTLPHFFPWLTGVSFQSTSNRILLPDIACLEDGRICDLARTGLIDHQLVVPKFLVEKIRLMTEEEDEFTRERAKQALESIHRLESYGISPTNTFNPLVEVNGLIQDQLLEVAKSHRATLISNDSSLKGTTKPEYANVPVVFLEAVASSLKPSIPKGQQFSIKIQRLGKEAQQGIGYLDDRTMVVVNGGGEFLGRQVKIQVLSQKYSASGKIIFCNLIEPIPSHDVKRHSVSVLSSPHDVFGEE